MRMGKFFKNAALSLVILVTITGGRAEAQRCQDSYIFRSERGNLEFGRGRGWHTCSGYSFVLQDDGILALYNRKGHAIWSIESYRRGDTIAFQQDGNVVLYKRGRPVWETGTSGHRGAYFAMQGDGNLVVYSRHGRILWSSGTEGR
jgi:hypothetical protein